MSARAGSDGLGRVRGVAVAAGALAVVVMAAAFASLCAYTGNPWPWAEVVHEAGDRTLLATLLYFEHAARELPLDLVLAGAIGASLRFAEPLSVGAAGAAAPADLRRRRAVLAAAGLFVVAAIVLGTLVQEGPAALLHNLMQMHTRPGEALSWGAHWRYHLLSRATLMLVSLGLATALAAWVRGLGARGDGAGARGFAAALALFGGATLVFAPDLDPFRDPVFIGHQVREVLTHALVTLPAAFALCLWLSVPGAAAPAVGPGTPGPSRPSAPAGVSLGWGAAAGAAGCVLGLYLLVMGLSLGSAQQGQTESAVLLVSPHFFEHGFSYPLVALLAGAVHQHLGLAAAGGAGVGEGDGRLAGR